MSPQILFLQINFKNQPKLCLFLPWARRQCHTWYRRLSRTWIHISPPRSSDNPSAQHCRTSTHTETRTISQSERELRVVDVGVGGETFLGVVDCLTLLVVDCGVLSLVLNLALLLCHCLVLSSTNV